MRTLFITLSIGTLLISSLPVHFAHAGRAISQAELEVQCRDKLRYAKKNLQGAFLFQLRRCMNNLRKQLASVEQLERRLQRADQHFWRAWEYGQRIQLQTRRSLLNAMDQQRKRREIVFKEKMGEERTAALLRDRRQRSLIFRAKERRVSERARDRQRRVADAYEKCRVHKDASRMSCIRRELFYAIHGE